MLKKMKTVSILKHEAFFKVVLTFSSYLLAVVKVSLSLSNFNVQQAIMIQHHRRRAGDFAGELWCRIGDKREKENPHESMFSNLFSSSSAHFVIVSPHTSIMTLFATEEHSSVFWTFPLCTLVHFIHFRQIIFEMDFQRNTNGKYLSFKALNLIGRNWNAVD